VGSEDEPQIAGAERNPVHFPDRVPIGQRRLGPITSSGTTVPVAGVERAGDHRTGKLVELDGSKDSGQVVKGRIRGNSLSTCVLHLLAGTREIRSLGSRERIHET